MTKEDFLLKEYECLRREIELTITQSRDLERNVAAAIAAIYVWLLKGANQFQPPKTAWFIPSILAILGAIRARGINGSFEEFHQYVEKVENHFLSDGSCPSGWEHCGKSGISVARGAVPFWALLILSTLGFAIWQWYKS